MPLVWVACPVLPPRIGSSHVVMRAGFTLELHSLSVWPALCARLESVLPAAYRCTQSWTPEGAAVGGGLPLIAQHCPCGLHYARWTHKTSPAMHAAHNCIQDMLPQPDAQVHAAKPASRACRVSIHSQSLHSHLCRLVPAGLTGYEVSCCTTVALTGPLCCDGMPAKMLSAPGCGCLPSSAADCLACGSLLQFTAKLRETVSRTLMPVIMVSAKAEGTLIKDGFDVGCNDFVRWALLLHDHPSCKRFPLCRHS